MPLDRTLSTIVSTSIPGLRDRRLNAVPFVTAEAASPASAERVNVRAAEFTVYKGEKNFKKTTMAGRDLFLSVTSIGVGFERHSC